MCNPGYLTAVGHEAEGDAALALDRHGVVQIENLAIGHQVLSVGLRESLFRVERARREQSNSRFSRYSPLVAGARAAVGEKSFEHMNFRGFDQIDVKACRVGSAAVLWPSKACQRHEE